MPFSVHKRLAPFGALAVATVLIVGCSSSNHTKNSDNRLASLSVSAGTLTPAFNITTDSYRLTVDGSVASTTVTATTNQATSTLTINGAAATSGTASAAITLPAGNTVIPVTVTAENGVAHTYTVTITRVLSSDASLANLSLSKGILSPNFSPTVKNYEVGLYSNQPSVTVTPTTAHPRAKVTVNGVAVTSGTASAAIPLPVGTTTIPVAVTSEDGSTVTTTKVDVRQLAPLTPVWVLDSINGSPVNGAVIDLYSQYGALLESGIPVGTDGSVTLGLDPLGTYTLVARATGSSQSSIVGFQPAKQSRADLYLQPRGMATYPAEAPRITEMSYSADGVLWTPISDGKLTESTTGFKYLKVSAISKCGISPTYSSGFGMGIAIDRTAGYTYTPASSIAENSVPAVVDGIAYYRSTFIFAVNINNLVAGTEHSIDVVAYDVANNRTEQRLWTTLVNASAAGTDPDISAVTPTSMIAQFQTFGISRNWFAVTPVDENPVSYIPLIVFNVGSGTGAPGIRGVDLFRSADGVNFDKVQSYQYGSLNKGTSGSYTIYDIDPSLTEGVTYTYKVKAWNNNQTNGGYTPFGTAVSSRILPPFTAKLATPAMNTISTTIAPKFTFTISNPALWDANVSDYFRFYLFIKDKPGNTIYGQYYRYNFIAGRFEKYVGTSFIDASTECSVDPAHTTISITLPTGTVLLPGMTYEWSIFGTAGSASASTSNACSFYRYMPGTGNAGSALSYGSTGDLSYGAVNGFFTLIIDPAAQ